MITLKDDVINKIKELPEYRLREVLDFVEFLSWRESSNGQSHAEIDPEDDPILKLAGTLSFPPLSNDEIDRELYGEFLLKEGD